MAGEACPGEGRGPRHPRLRCPHKKKAWMAGTRTAMTVVVRPCLHCHGRGSTRPSLAAPCWTRWRGLIPGSRPGTAMTIVTGRRPLSPHASESPQQRNETLPRRADHVTRTPGAFAPGAPSGSAGASACARATTGRGHGLTQINDRRTTLSNYQRHREAAPPPGGNNACNRRDDANRDYRRPGHDSPGSGGTAVGAGHQRRPGCRCDRPHDRHRQRGRPAAPRRTRHRRSRRTPALVVAGPFRVGPGQGLCQIAWPHGEGHHVTRCRHRHRGDRSRRDRDAA